MGGWGLKDLKCFSKALATKDVWCILKGNKLWVSVVTNKYISPLSVVEWFCIRDMQHKNISNSWKAIILAFDLIGDWLEWRVGDGMRIWIGQDPWIGGNGKHLLPLPLVGDLREWGHIYLGQVHNYGNNTPLSPGWLKTMQLNILDHDF